MGVSKFSGEEMRSRYIWIRSADHYAERVLRNGAASFAGRPQYEGLGFYNLATGYMMDLPQTDEICCPAYIIKDWEPYQSWVLRDRDGKPRVVTGRADRRNELAEVEDREKPLVPYERVTKRPPGLANKDFVTKRGGKIVERAKEGQMAFSEEAADYVKGWHKERAVKTVNGAIVVE